MPLGRNSRTKPLAFSLEPPNFSFSYDSNGNRFGSVRNGYSSTYS